MTNPQDIPADELSDLQGLLQLKNYERPADGYFEDFLDEFHRRQRVAAQEQTGVSSVFNRFTAWFHDLGAAKWALGAGVAYAVLMIGFFAIPGTESTPGVATGSEEILPGDRRLEHVELEKEVESSEQILEVLPQEF